MIIVPANARQEDVSKALQNALTTYGKIMDPLKLPVTRRQVPVSTEQLVGEVNQKLDEMVGKLIALGFDKDAADLKRLQQTLLEAAGVLPVKMTRRCWGWHSWSTWVHVSTCMVQKKNSSYDNITSGYLVMMSECMNCGQMRTKNTKIMTTET